MPSPSTSLLRALSFATLLLVPSLAGAQPDQARRDAEARFREGLTRVQASDFEGARLAFVQAYAVLKSSDVLWNLALSEMRSNHPLEALGHFKDYVKDARTTEPERQKARKYVDELHARVGRLSIDAPAGATLVIDGRVFPQTAPLSEPVDVPTGEHFVEARLGDRARLLRVQAPAGAVVALQFRADEIVPGGAATAVNAPASSASSGSAPAGPSPSEPAIDKKDNTTKLVVAGGVVGLGVVAGIGAVAMALSSSSSASDADDAAKGLSSNACAAGGGGAADPRCATLDEARRSEIDKQNWAVGLGVTGGVLVAAGVATFLLWPDKRASSSSTAKVRIAPMVGPTHGAVLTTSF